MTPGAVVLRHLGALHAYETALVLVVAFGPFLVIAALVLRERRRGRQAQDAARGDLRRAGDRPASVSQKSEPGA